MTEHGRPARPEPPRVGADLPAPTHAERSRTLIAQAAVATLATLASERTDVAGHPYGSLVTVAADGEGRPLMLLSSLAEHTQNLAARAEASVLVSEAIGPGADPLALGRVTLLGRCARLEGGEALAARAVFLARHPRAAYYADFKDFAFWRLEPSSLRYIGGFGRMSWVAADDYRRASPDPLADAAAGIVAHMNDDHADALVSYARALAGIGDATSARMTEVDRYGFEIAVQTPDAPRVARIAFEAPLATSEEVRKAMVGLVKSARAKLAGG